MRPITHAAEPYQESVWASPCPARAEPSAAHIVIEHRGKLVADTRSSVRTLETSHPSTYYIPLEDIAPNVLVRALGNSLCEWKGVAVYWDVAIGETVLRRVGWSFPSPSSAFEILRNHVSFYAWAFDRSSVDGEPVVPQAGGFYGGLITSKMAGLFKAGPGRAS